MAVMTLMSVEQQARDLAVQAHGEDLNQHDGEPYIRHVERVVEHLRRMGADEVTLAVAWLHDIVEDTVVTIEQIRYLFGEVIGDAVDAITHRKHEPRVAYYERVGPNRLALTVKMADGRDNQDPERKARLAPETRERLDRKYRLQNWCLMPWIIHHLKETH